MQTFRHGLVICLHLHIQVILNTELLTKLTFKRVMIQNKLLTRTTT